MDTKRFFSPTARSIWKSHIKTPLKRNWLAATGRPLRIDRRLLPSEQHSASPDYAFPERDAASDAATLSSGLCRQAQLTSPAFRYWLGQLDRSTVRMHRKLWELAYVTQALFERGCLESGKRGLGFAVGEEPLPDYFAERGVDVLATDLDASDARSQAWRRTGQHLSNIADAEVNRTALGGSVTTRAVDMNQIPDDLSGEFDFNWSTCSFEHCGSIELGLTFLRNQLRTLKPGGVAVHTTEFNLTSNDATIEHGSTVIFRRRDVERIVGELESEGHSVEPISWDPGDHEFDKHIDWPPYTRDRHLRLALKRFAATSIGLILRKNPTAAAAAA